MSPEPMQKHGSVPYRELEALGLRPEDILDFSASINPFPLPARLLRSELLKNLGHYPDPEQREIVERLSRLHRLPQELLVVCGGATEAIFALPRLFRRAVAFGPTYGDYGEAFGRAGIRMGELPFPSTDAAWRECVERLRGHPPELLVVCNPNNPTGDYLEPERLAALAEALPQTCLLVDEAYQEMGEECRTIVPWVERCANLLVLKSLTKPFGVAGLRCGFAAAAAGLAAQIRGELPPWSVNIVAQRLVRRLLDELPRFAQSWNKILTEKRRLAGALERYGLPVRSGRGPYLLIRVGDAPACRAWLLAQHRMAVRDCSSFGLPEWIRVMPGRSSANDALAKTLGDWPERDGNGRRRS